MYSTLKSRWQRRQITYSLKDKQNWFNQWWYNCINFTRELHDTRLEIDSTNFNFYYWYFNAYSCNYLHQSDNSISTHRLYAIGYNVNCKLLIKKEQKKTSGKLWFWEWLDYSQNFKYVVFPQINMECRKWWLSFSTNLGQLFGFQALWVCADSSETPAWCSFQLPWWWFVIDCSYGQDSSCHKYA